MISIAVGTIQVINAKQFTPGSDFRNNLWAPAYLVTQGQNPYQLNPDIKESFLNGVKADWLVPVWFPMGLSVLFPLGWLSQTQATNLWFISNVALLSAIIWLSTGLQKPYYGRFSLTLIAVFTFPAVVAHLKLGQFTIFSTLMFLLAAFYVEDRLPIKTSLFSLIALTKPQLGILVIPGLVVTTLHHRGTKAVAMMAVLSLLIGGMMLGVMFQADSHWYVSFFNAQQINPSWKQPSLFYILNTTFNTYGKFIWLIVATILFCINIWLWIKYSPQKAVFWGLALTPLITPYLWSWDFILLIPLTVQSVFRLGWISRLIIVGFVVAWMIILRIDKNFGDPQYWWIPWLIVGFIVTGYVIDKIANSEPLETE